MKTLSLLILLLTVGACAVHQNPAKTRVYTPVGKFEYKCPPGHAKKGQC